MAENFLQAKTALCYCANMRRLSKVLLAVVLAFSGCAPATITPGATLLSGINQYHGDMQRLGGSEAQWPARQRAAASLKKVITGTIGASPEFYRLIDLDMRKREFALTIRETSVRPDRRREMEDEMAQMNDKIAALKSVIRSQIAAVRFEDNPERRIEDVAVRGLISLSIEDFSANGGSRSLDSPSTKVGAFAVTNMGLFSVVRAPDGRSFKCSLLGTSEDGAGIRCDPVE